MLTGSRWKVVIAVMFFFFCANPPWAFENPLDNFSTLFRTRRDLLKPLKNTVLLGTDLSIETADLLIDLHEIRLRAKAQGAEGAVAPDGFVPMNALRDDLLVIDTLLSRRISELADMGLVEVRTLHGRSQPEDAPKLHGKSLLVRISPAGIRVIEPVLRRYEALAGDLLAEATQKDLLAHKRVNVMISARIRELYPAAKGDAEEAAAKPKHRIRAGN